MKKFIVILVSLFVLGGLVVFLPHLSVMGEKPNRDSLVNKFAEVESNTKTIEQLEIPAAELEIGLVDKNQVLINNIEVLYKYLTFHQVNQVKLKLQFYLLHNLKDTKECNIKVDTLHEETKDLDFLVEVNKYKDIMVIVNKEDAGNEVNISFLQSR